MKTRVDEFKQHLPLLSALCNPGLRERHWVKMTEIAGQELKPSAVSTTGGRDAPQLCTQGPSDRGVHVHILYTYVHMRMYVRTVHTYVCTYIYII